MIPVKMPSGSGIRCPGDQQTLATFRISILFGVGLPGSPRRSPCRATIGSRRPDGYRRRMTGRSLPQVGIHEGLVPPGAWPEGMSR